MMALEALLGWNFVAFSIAIYVVTMLVRRLVEFVSIQLRAVKYFADRAEVLQNIWAELFLPFMPATIGLLGALLFKHYPYPTDMTSGISRGIFGLVAGLLSGVIYRVIKAGLKSKFNLAANSADGDEDISANIPVQQVTKVTKVTQVTTTDTQIHSEATVPVNSDENIISVHSEGNTIPAEEEPKQENK